MPQVLHVGRLLESTRLGEILLIPSSLVYLESFSYKIGMVKLVPYRTQYKQNHEKFSDEYILANHDKSIFIRMTKSNRRLLEVHDFTIELIKDFIEQEKYKQYGVIWGVKTE